LLVGNYVVFYSIRTDEITVVRVIDSRMDIEAEFRR
jgi:hypothetical protein